ETKECDIIGARGRAMQPSDQITQCIAFEHVGVLHVKGNRSSAKLLHQTLSISVAAKKDRAVAPPGTLAMQFQNPLSDVRAFLCVLLIRNDINLLGSKKQR